MGKRSKLGFSIRYKILSVMTVLLVAAIGLYLLLATTIFRQDKTELVFDLNKSVVSTLSTEVDTSLRGAADKLRLYALLFADKDRSSSHIQDTFKEIISSDPFLVRLELYQQRSSGQMEMASKIFQDDFVKLYGTDDTFFENLLTKQRPVPFDEIRAHSLSVWNATVEKSPPLLGMGISVIKEGAHGVPERIMAVVGYAKVDLFLKNLRSSTLTQAFIVGPDGRVLVHPRSEFMTRALDFSSSPIVYEMQHGSFATGVKKFSEHGHDLLGAYSRVNLGGLGVVSEVDNRKAFMAVQNLITRSMLFAMIVVTATFIATVFFSRSLTRPLRRLMAAMERVADGHFDTEVRFKTHDEIEVLAGSFNQMTQDLRQSRLQLEEINRELENKVADRTKKLEEQNRAVKEAQEALLRTTRLASVGEIAGRTAHEVLNPLTSLMARVQKVQKRLSEDIVNHKNLLGEIAAAWKKELDEKGSEALIQSWKQPSSIDPKMTLLQEDIANINQVFSGWDAELVTLTADTRFLLAQASRIEKILGQMRSLSAVSGRKAQLRAHDLIHDAVNIVADLFSKQKIQLMENFRAQSDMVSVDHDEMLQVLTNLLRNSLYAVQEASLEMGKGIVRLETSEENGKFFIDIVDNGVGISPGNQSKLFENQFSTKSPDLGTGLGLSISRRFVRAFNGDLYLVSSVPKEATQFRIELPLKEATVKSEAA